MHRLLKNLSLAMLLLMIGLFGTGLCAPTTESSTHKVITIRLPDFVVQDEQSMLSSTGAAATNDQEKTELMNSTEASQPTQSKHEMVNKKPSMMERAKLHSHNFILHARNELSRMAHFMRSMGLLARLMWSNGAANETIANNAAANSSTKSSTDTFGNCFLKRIISRMNHLIGHTLGEENSLHNHSSHNPMAGGPDTPIGEISGSVIYLQAPDEVPTMVATNTTA